MLFGRETTTTRSQGVPCTLASLLPGHHCPSQGATCVLSRVTPIPWKGFCYIFKQTWGLQEAQECRAAIFHGAWQRLEQHRRKAQGFSPLTPHRYLPSAASSSQPSGTGKQHTKHQWSKTQFTPTFQSAAASSPVKPVCSTGPAPWELAHASPGSQQQCFQDAVCPSSLLGWGGS